MHRQNPIPGELPFMLGMVVLLLGVAAMDWLAAAVGASLWVVGMAAPTGVRRPRGR